MSGDVGGDILPRAKNHGSAVGPLCFRPAVAQRGRAAGPRPSHHVRGSVVESAHVSSAYAISASVHASASVSVSERWRQTQGSTSLARKRAFEPRLAALKRKRDLEAR